MHAANPPNVTCVGRFAPSPTGPLHFGSLVAAVGSYLSAKSQGGEWLVRIEDLDTPRNMPGAADDILRTLEAFGLHWDGAVVHQSRRLDAYHEALEQLRARGLTYPCVCSRKEIADSFIAGDSAGLVYPGTCRAGCAPGRVARAERVRVDNTVIEFQDRIQGPVRSDIATQCGDFIVKRADGPFAYQLAVVVDDADAGVTEVVRGADLLDSTPRQILVQRYLGLPTPVYAHLPVAVNDQGMKLSKQTGAQPLDAYAANAMLCAALRFLGQAVPESTDIETPETIIAWAVARFRENCIPNITAPAVVMEQLLM
jgi:glutamyl-Q tRNA(Asp) synthetase